MYPGSMWAIGASSDPSLRCHEEACPESPLVNPIIRQDRSSRTWEHRSPACIEILQPSFGLKYSFTVPLLCLDAFYSKILVFLAIKNVTDVVQRTSRQLCLFLFGALVGTGSPLCHRTSESRCNRIVLGSGRPEDRTPAHYASDFSLLPEPPL